jgi:hypothetical protein
MNHVAEDQLIAFALGDAEAGTCAAVESHLHECAACRAELEAIRAVLEAAAAAPVPERGPDYGARVWARLSPALPAEPPDRTRDWRGWLAAAAVLALVAGAFLAGRWTTRPAPTVASARPAPSPDVATAGADRHLIRERVVLAALADHLDRTERGLVEIVNTDAEGTVDISAEQAWARDLLDANRLYRLSARGTASPALSQLLDELEPVLLAIVHSPSRLTPAEFNALRARIEDRSLVFKVRVSGADVRARQQTLRHPGDPTS